MNTVSLICVEDDVISAILDWYAEVYQTTDPKLQMEFFEIKYAAHRQSRSRKMDGRLRELVFPFVTHESQRTKLEFCIFSGFSDRGGAYVARCSFEFEGGRVTRAKREQLMSWKSAEECMEWATRE